MRDFRNLAMFFFGRYANTKFRRGCRVPFSKGGSAGELSEDNGATPRTPSESAIAAFDGRRLSKVLLRYF